jgi:hypothetical protein
MGSSLMDDSEVTARARNLVEQLSRTPRFAGSPEETAARALCRKELERSGFECAERPFEYSQWPARWGPPLAAAVQAAAIFVVARTAIQQGPLTATIIGGALFVALFFVSADARRRRISDFPLMRSRSVNLEATRGNPTLWLVAHLDSKSQTVPMLGRIAATIALAGVTAAALVVLLLALADITSGESVWPFIQVAAVVAALPSVLCWVREDSPGAVDNASGVVAVLLAVESLRAVGDIGVLITSGEELGLAGARAWAANARPGIVALNCDTIDDGGGWRCMYTGPPPKRIIAAAAAVGPGMGLKLTLGRLIPGILADSIAFADRGLEAVTVSRGTLSTLARIHTRRDNSTALNGSGVAQASVLLSALAKELS